jgi:hypothetical protein
MRTSLIFGASIVFAAALVLHFYRLGGPYFDRPLTVQDHVASTPYPSRDVILLAARAAELLPRGATVTAVHPPEGPDYDLTLALAASGMMPHHRVVRPDLGGDRASLPRYVLAVRKELDHPAYVLRMTMAEGRIYEVRR